MIKTEDLRKEFGELLAVDGVSLSARGGEIFGLLGPNGAGKTTTISCISGLLTPTAGRVSVMGHDVVRDGIAARRSLGVVPQEIALYDDLNAAQNLEYWGGAQGLRGAALRTAIDRALELTGLTDRAKDSVKNFSGGMKRRLNFACGIVHEPKVLLLDEPTVGVDPQSRVRLLDLVREQARAGTLRSLHHALHGRGRSAVRSAGDRRSRQDHRLGNACRTARHDGRARPDPAFRSF